MLLSHNWVIKADEHRILQECDQNSDQKNKGTRLSQKSWNKIGRNSGMCVYFYHITEWLFIDA